MTGTGQDRGQIRPARFRAILLALLLVLAPPVLLAALAATAAAQETAAPIDYAAWDKDATQAEASLAEGKASSQALEQLRARIVDWRSRFARAQTANQAQIETVQSQIAALGPVPADGAAEVPEIAARRSALNASLAQLQAPGLSAVEAYSRADGVIRQIDATIRARQADELLRLWPSPANPVNWPAGFAVLTQGGHTLWTETAEAWSNPARRTQLRNNLPAILLYLAIAAVLLSRGPAFMERLTARLQSAAAMRLRHVAAALVSIGQVVVPVAGMMLLVAAMRATGMTGMRSGALIDALPKAAFAFFAARWLGNWLFNSDLVAERDRIIDRRAEAMFLVLMIGLMAALEMFRLAFVTEVRPPLSQAARSVWAAPMAVAVSLFLFRLGQLIRRRPDGETPQFRDRLLRIAGTATVAASLLGPLLAVIGYVAAANALIWPTVMSLALIGLLLLLQRFATDIYLALMRMGEEGRDTLVPVLIGLTLTLLSLPFFALVWGARTADLYEVWTRISEGVTLGGIRISPAVFFKLVVVFALGYMATRIVQGALKTTVLPRTRLDKGVQNAVAAGVGYVGLFLAALMAVNAAGLDLSSLAIVAGALSVGIGFGLQNIVQNFISGIILLIERPISEGDMIEVGGQIGVVKGISVRSTWIETFDRTDVIVPNGDLVAGVVTNLTRGNLTGRLILPVGVAYGSDTRRVEAILHEIAEAQPLVLVDPEPKVFFVAFGADSLNFEIRAILSDVNFKMQVTSEIHHEINRRFIEEGIEIPFAQRDLWIRNPEALRADAAGTAAPKGAGAHSAPHPAAPHPSAAPAPAAAPATDTRRIRNDPEADEAEET